MVKRDRAALEARVTGLRAVLEADPDDASAWYGLGRTLAQLAGGAGVAQLGAKGGTPGDATSSAIVAFRRCLAARPGYAAAYRELGRCLLESGEAAAAQLAFEDGIVAANESGDLQTARELQTFLQRAQRTLGEAASAPRATGATSATPTPAAPASVEVDPGVRAEARQLYRQAFEEYARGNTASAIEGYEQALAKDATLAIAWNGLSLALGAQGELAAAVEAARKLIGLEPDDPLSHTNLSRLLMQQGLIPEAEDERAVAMRLQMRAAKG